MLLSDMPHMHRHKLFMFIPWLPLKQLQQMTHISQYAGLSIHHCVCLSIHVAIGVGISASANWHFLFHSKRIRWDVLWPCHFFIVKWCIFPQVISCALYHGNDFVNKFYNDYYHAQVIFIPRTPLKKYICFLHKIPSNM